MISSALFIITGMIVLVAALVLKLVIVINMACMILHPYVQTGKLLLAKR